MSQNATTPEPTDGDDQPDVTEAMAVFSSAGQGDDESGGDALAGASHDAGGTGSQDHRQPNGPA